MSAGRNGVASMIFRRRQKQWLLIAGLGNPGRGYRENRHNVGFMLIDQLARDWESDDFKNQSSALIVKSKRQSKQIILAKPQTFMNAAGTPISSLARFYKIDPSRLMVIYDDLDLPVGTIRMRPSGGSGGHRGMRSVIREMGSSDFARIRVGIGRPSGRMEPADYVLQDFDNDERTIIDIALRQAVDCIGRFLTDGIDEAMTYCNTGSAS